MAKKIRRPQQGDVVHFVDYDSDARQGVCVTRPIAWALPPDDNPNAAIVALGASLSPMRVTRALTPGAVGSWHFADECPNALAD